MAFLIKKKEFIVKRFFNLLIILFSLSVLCYGQGNKGQIVVTHILSSSIQRNPGGENPLRRVTIYLPPDYDKTTGRYPVIYFLHGFTRSDSLLIAINHFDKLMDKAISTGKIKPVIVVMPNEYTLYRGSFYTNSSLTGNWADFTAIELVAYVDKNYRTIPDRKSRVIAGHSMGGHGAIKLGMLFPYVFANVYALSPAILDLKEDMGKNSKVYKRVREIKTREVLVTGYKDFRANAVVAAGRAFSPNPDNPPFYTDLPFTYQGDSLIVNNEALALWNKNLPVKMVDSYVDSLKSLNALKLDWGRNDGSKHIPVTCSIFSKKLEKLGIHHYAEEYIGNHTNKIWTDDGRVLNDMLPFFDTYLKFK